MQSKYAPSQAFLACCPLQSLPKLHLLFLPRSSSGYILCSAQDILLVLVFLLSIDLYLQFQRQCRWRQESKGSLLSSYTPNTILKLLQSPKTQEIKYNFLSNPMPAYPICLLRYQHKLQVNYHLLNVFIIQYYILRIIERVLE